MVDKPNPNPNPEPYFHGYEKVKTLLFMIRNQLGVRGGIEFNPQILFRYFYITYDTFNIRYGYSKLKTSRTKARREHF